MNKIDQGHDSGVGALYSIFKKYLRFNHDKIYYRHTYAINTEAIPKDGTPLLIVSNHQNCLNDAFGILFNINDRKPRFITRGDVFAANALFARFLYSIGLLPSFRMKTEGISEVGKNKETFRVSAEALIGGNTVVMYPEAGHQDKRWLGDFTYGYTRLAFEAAEAGGFEKDVVILPSCNHYSDYFGIRNDFMVRFGTPISLSPWYEMYKTKPRTAQREVSKLVRKQISGMMLNITDLEHYRQIDFLRGTYGIYYAYARGLDSDILPQKLESDKELVRLLDGAAENVKAVLYKDTADYMAGLSAAGIEDRHFENSPKAGRTLAESIGMLILLPVWAVSLWPSLFIYGIGLGAARKITDDKMFEGTFLFAVSALVSIPLFSLASFVAAGMTVGWWAALVYVALFPCMAVFAWNYAKKAKALIKDIRYLLKKKDKRTAELSDLRDRIFKTLNDIVLERK